MRPGPTPVAEPTADEGDAPPSQGRIAPAISSRPAKELAEAFELAMAAPAPHAPPPDATLPAQELAVTLASNHPALSTMAPSTRSANVAQPAATQESAEPRRARSLVWAALALGVVLSAGAVALLRRPSPQAATSATELVSAATAVTSVPSSLALANESSEAASNASPTASTSPTASATASTSPTASATASTTASTSPTTDSLASSQRGSETPRRTPPKREPTPTVASSATSPPPLQPPAISAATKPSATPPKNPLKMQIQ